MTLMIRPRIPADFPAIAALENLEAERPITVADMEQSERERRKEFPYLALVAELGGQIVGRAVAGRNQWNHAQDLFCSVMVHPDHRRRGIGRALLDAFQPFFAAHQPRQLFGWVKDSRPWGVKWAEAHGFTMSHHIFGSKLDLSRFDSAAFRAQVEQVKASGVRFVRFPEIQSPETEQRFYELFNAYGDDTPDAEDWRVMDFDEWRKWALESERSWPEGWVIALAPNGDWAGYTMMERNPRRPERAHIDLTGVTRPYRGQGIALAIKVVAAEVARELGVTELTTKNHSANAPMLAVNRKLGYVPLPGMYRVWKPFANA